MRFHCDIPGLTDNWVDVSDIWTRREKQELTQADEEQTLAFIHRKVTACQIEVVGGEAITDPKNITAEALDDIDLRLIGFLGGVLVHATNQLHTLGNWSGRPLSNGTGTTETVTARPTQRRNSTAGS